jgi:hypothetical protein
MSKQRRPATKPKPRQARKTALLIGEGNTDVAFVKYLMELYNARGRGVACTVRCAYGKGPEYIMALPSRYERTADYDHKAVPLDTDIPWPEKNVADARSRRIELLPCTPCLEWLLLDVLGKPIRNNATDCKRAVKVLGIDLLRSDCYKRHFPKSLLDTRSCCILTLRRLIEIASGKKLFPGR